MSHDLAVKISVYDLKVTKRDDFPLKIYDSDFLSEALDQLKVSKQTKSGLKKVIKDKDFKKAFAYMFWVFLALKFRERNFGDRDHYNGMDSVTKKLVDNR